MAVKGIEELVDTTHKGTVIKVLGIGGAGGNAVDHMIRESIGGVEFVAVNTDAQALARCLAPTDQGADRLFRSGGRFQAGSRA